MKQIKKLDNYQVLFHLRVLKAILGIFVDSFLVLYFLKLSYNNILPLGIYRITSMFVVFITIFLLRNLSKSKHRINLLRIAIILDFVYFLSIIFLQDKIIDYIYLVGILYGIEEGFYYSVFSTFESNGISNTKRTKFIGNFTFIKSLLSIIFPLIFGSLIKTTSFLECVALILIIVYIRLVLSFEFKDYQETKNEKTTLKEFINIVKNDDKIKQLYKVNFFYGLTYSKGALQNIIMIYIIKVFSDSLSLGIFTSIFAIITSIIGLLFAKYLKKRSYKSIIKISMILTIISLLIMILNCNTITIIIFNFFQTISTGFVDLINDNSRTNISNLQTFNKKYKVEYFMGVEFSLFVGRMISQTLFILMVFVDVIYIIPVFIMFLLMFMNSSIKLQEITFK